MFSWLGYKSSSSRVLPRPSGLYKVGFVDYEWSPQASKYTDKPAAFSLVRFYYPAEDTGESNDAPEYEDKCGKWIPSSEYLPGYGYYLKIPRILSVPAFKWLAGHIKLWAVENAKVSKAPSKFPVIIFSHGLGGIRTTYSTICTDLASHGFLVAVIEHRLLWRWLGSIKRAFKRFFHFKSSQERGYNGSFLFRDGSASMTVEQELVKPYDHPVENIADDALHTFRARQLGIRTQEVSSTIDLLESINQGSVPRNIWRLVNPSSSIIQSQAIDSLKNRLDFSKIVAIGHSFGAATSFFASSHDDRIKAVIGMDPWMYPLPRPVFSHGRPHPLLVINSEYFHWAANLDAIKSLLNDNNKSSEGSTMMVTLKGTGHMDQSDLTVALPPYVTSRFRPNQTSDPTAVLRSNNDIILAFLQQKVGIMGLQYISINLPDDSDEVEEFQERQQCIVDFI